jgi:hypothetical protein
MKQLIKGKQYIFLDESGRPETITIKGKNLVAEGVTSEYLVICAVVTQNPMNIQRQVLNAKLAGLASTDLANHLSIKHSLEVFHASSDTEPIRQYVYRRIADMTDFKALILVAEKLKAYDSFQKNRDSFYNAMCGQLLKRVLHTHEECSIVISRKDSNLGIQKNLNTEIDRLRLEYFEEHGIEVKTRFNFEHNPHYSHSALQIADYLAFSVFKVFENKERKYFELVKGQISFIQDIFNKKVYTKENPL